jgi:hypothetical protein
VNAKKTIAQGEVFTDVESVKLYDLALSDGSFMRVTNDKGELPSSIDLQGYTAYGIVFYTGNTNDEYLNNMGYTHGLIVSLKDGNDGQTSVWQYTVDVSTIANPSHMDSNLRNGYEATTNLIEFESQQDLNMSYSMPNYVMPIESLFGFRRTQSRPDNTSKWFFPTVAELLSLSSVANNIDTILGWLAGDTLLQKCYWSCTEQSSYNTHMVNMDSNTSESKIKTECYYSRFICAF